MRSDKAVIIAIFSTLLICASVVADEEQLTLSKGFEARNMNPAVALNHKGDALVVWDSWDVEANTQHIYATFMKYSSKTGSFKVKKPLKLNTEGDSSFEGQVVFNEETKSFICVWLRAFPNNTDSGLQMVARKLNYRGKPKGEETILFAEGRMHIKDIKLIKYNPIVKLAGAGESHPYVLVFRKLDLKDYNNQASSLHIAYLDKNGTKLINEKVLKKTNHKGSSQFDGSLEFNDAAHLPDGSFFIPYRYRSGDTRTVHLLSVSPAFTIKKELELGVLKDSEKVWICQASAKFYVVSWNRDVGEMVNQIIRSNGKLVKKPYPAKEYYTNPYTAMATLRKGGIAQMFSYDGVILSSKGKAKSTFSTATMGPYHAQSQAIEFAENRILVVHTGMQDGYVQPVQATILEIK